MNGKRNTIYAASYVLVKRNKDILLLRRHNTNYQDGKYTLPAGHVDEGELPSQSAIRELLEETGLTVAVSNVRHVHTMHRLSDSDRTYVDYYFEASDYSGQPKIMEPDKCDDMIWVNIDTLPEEIMLQNVVYALERIKKHETFSEFNQGVFRVGI